METTQGNGADQPRRARSSTERSRAHRARKKLEREAALKAEREAALQAEAERVAEAVAGVPGDVAYAENTVADAAPGPAEQKAEREAAALHEAGKVEREVGATETATIERVADDVASAENTVAGAAPGPAEISADPHAVADSVAFSENGVPARAVERFAWRIMWSPTEHPPVPHPARRSPTLVLTLFSVGIGLGAVGLAIDVTFATSYAPESVWGSILLALIGTAIYILATALPATACALWDHGRRLLAMLAWCVWPLMVGLSLMASTGFSATYIGDALANRSTVATKASNTASDLQQWRNERTAITEKRSVEEIKLQLLLDRRKVDRIDRDAFEVTLGCRRLTADTTKACSPVLPIVQALAAAQRRDDLTGKITDAEKTQGSTPTIKSADPQAEQVSKLAAWITRGWIAATPEDIALMRILGLTIVPSLSGLAFLFAFALAATRTALAARP